MQFDNQELKTKFSVPDNPTVRQVLQYDSLVELQSFGSDNTYERLWNGIGALVSEWESEYVQIKDNLDSITGQEAIDVIKWAALSVFSFRQSLKEVEKN
jgi:hypothetical protein